LNPATNETRARLYFIRDARCEAPTRTSVHSGKPTCTHEEIPLLQFLPEPTSATSPEKEGNIKRNDHGYDAARYALHSHLVGGPSDLISLK
jgi:hypothetical protein